MHIQQRKRGAREGLGAVAQHHQHRERGGDVRYDGVRCAQESHGGNGEQHDLLWAEYFVRQEPAPPAHVTCEFVRTVTRFVHFAHAPPQRREYHEHHWSSGGQDADLLWREVQRIVEHDNVWNERGVGGAVDEVQKFGKQEDRVPIPRQLWRVADAPVHALCGCGVLNERNAVRL